MNPSEPRPTKNQKRLEAREKARVLREAQSKKSKRNKVLLQGSLAVVVLGVISIVTVLILTSLRPPSPGPLNMQSTGLKLEQGFQAVRTPALQPDEVPVLSTENPDGIPAINIFIDYSCPVCKQFEELNGPLLRTWLENGTATVEYHPLSFLDAQTAGTRYATRAGNSAACVAEHSPDTFFEFNELLLANQPVKPERYELTDGELVLVAQTSGVDNLEAIEQCIKDETFSSWILATSKVTMQSGPVPVRNSEIAAVNGTPTVLVNGKLYDPRLSDLATFVASLEESE